MSRDKNDQGSCVYHDFDKYCPFGVQNLNGYCPKRVPVLNETYFPIQVMNLQALEPLETLIRVNHIFWTILPTLCCFAIARIVTQKWNRLLRNGARFFVEFVLIIVPVILSVNLANHTVIYVVMLLIVLLLLLMLCKSCLMLAQERYFELGRHPHMLTMTRASINILTAVCILAIDFESFPKEFRKTRGYGVGLMDVGIGLFIFAMGTVSRRPTCAADLSKLSKLVARMLLLGLARSIVIEYIDYHQDETEYGKHLNAFFTLGFTKLIGTFMSGVATTDWQLLFMGLGVLAVHEFLLQSGVSDYVMDMDNERNNFFDANREGICSLPGFIAIFLISLYIGRMLQTHVALTYTEFMQKLKTMALISTALWLLVVLCAFSVDIARVTCNFGYAAWVLAIAVTITTFYMFIFDLVLDTVWPVSNVCKRKTQGEVEELLQEHGQHSNQNCVDFWLPSLAEAVNRNGLTFFLIANVLTGGVNLFFKPSERSDLESVVILCGYMLIATGFIYLLFRLKIRIG